MGLVTRSEIEAFEQRLDHAVRTGEVDELDVIGYGEVTIAVKLATPHGDLACKRLVPFSSLQAAEHTAALIASYIDQLGACGIDVVETETPILERPSGHVLYCVQPLLPPGTLGPDFLRGKTADEAAPYVRRIFEHIRASVTPSLAPDGQLSNWAIEGDRLRYLDVGTPFLRDEKGRDLFDLALCLDHTGVDAGEAVGAFERYMEHGGTPVSRAEFEANMSAKLADAGFLQDVPPLLRAGVDHDPREAWARVHAKLVVRLRGEPWKGTQ